ncbi:uncharacterized protein [Haliotis cracherodii]|uniref:uncharacterized protein n=1 Tax=Haliotis cracherodii TaxID=6455 RepID=UPI0039EA97BD
MKPSKSRFTHFKGFPGRRENCVKILQSGYWRNFYCGDESPFVCMRKADCDPGWGGDYCDRPCHCYLNYSCSGTTCPYGCQPGWTGSLCVTPREKTKVSYYCMKQREGGYSLMVSLIRWDLELSSTYKRIGAVNAEGEISPHCLKYHKVMHGEKRFSVQIQNVSGLLKPACPAETVADGILRWTFRLQKKEGIESVEDEELQVQCDLSEADDATHDAESVVMENIRERSLTTATQTRVSVRTYIAYPDTLEPVTNVSLGDRVRLVATLPEGDDVVNPFFYPRNCQAVSPDGKVSMQLIDFYGCSENSDIGFGTLNQNSAVFQSDIFPMFRPLGYTEVVFSCTLVVPYLHHVAPESSQC